MTARNTAGGGMGAPSDVIVSVVERGALAQAASVAQTCGLLGTPLIVCDRTVADLYLERVKALFEGARACVLPAGIHADEGALGRVLMMSDKADYLIALGSGTVGDVVRYVAARAGLEFMTLATAPSMDGFASSVSPLILGGFKTTFNAKPPRAIVGDVDILAQAPAPMIAAGLGDVLGKNTALMDWRLGRMVLDEPLDEGVWGFMDDALKRCEAAAPGLPAREPEAVRLLMECLVQSGEAIRRWGSSRPASGAEHHMSHFWEIRSIARGEGARLHGDKVGVATLIAMEMYRRFFERETPPEPKPYSHDGWEEEMRRVFGGAAAQGVIGETGHVAYDQRAIVERVTARWDDLRAAIAPMLSKAEGVRALLSAANGPVTLKELGIGADDARDALLHAHNLRDRFTIQRLLSVWGILPAIAEGILEDMA